MRDIKFRAFIRKHKNVDEKDWNKMVEISGIDFGDPFGEYEFEKDGEFYCIDKKYIELMQYTGLKDKNNKEIYEGDIILTYIKAKNKETNKTIEPYDNKEAVSWGVWEDDEYGYKINTWLLGANYLAEYTKYGNSYWDAVEEKFEVVGNIYENPELIK